MCAPLGSRGARLAAACLYALPPTASSGLIADMTRAYMAGAIAWLPDEACGRIDSCRLHIKHQP